MSGDVLEALAEARRQGRSVVMATTVRTEGDPPSAPGNRALFGPDGALLAGTIGCNGLDRRGGADGHELLAAGDRSSIRRYTSFEGEPGEGAVEVFLEAFGARPRLVVGSAGPVADALAAIGEVVGMAVRAEAPGSAGFAAAVEGLGPKDAVVFTDHDDPDLLPSLTAVLAGEAGYVGVMGSRRHTPGFVAKLRDPRDRALDPRGGHGRHPRPSRLEPQHRRHPGRALRAAAGAHRKRPRVSPRTSVDRGVPRGPSPQNGDFPTRPREAGHTAMQGRIAQAVGARPPDGTVAPGPAPPRPTCRPPARTDFVPVQRTLPDWPLCSQSLFRPFCRMVWVTGRRSASRNDRSISAPGTVSQVGDRRGRQAGASG